MALLKHPSPASGEARGQGGEAAGESDLLACLFAGDRQAAEELVERTYELIYASLYRLSGGDADLSADLTQETYRKAWKSLPGFNRGCQFSTWLYRIAYNTFLNHVRRPRRFDSLESESVPPLADPGRGGEEEVCSQEMGRRLRHGVLGLPDELRVTVTARFWGELPVKEIAAMEGVTPVAIRKRLRRAFQILRSTLDEEAS